MDMRRFSVMLTLLCIMVISAVSCRKEGPSLFEGNYSFKTSGTITVQQSGVESAERMEISLSNEMGQMDILAKDGRNVLVSMNVMGGDIINCDASVTGDNLQLGPFRRKISLNWLDSGIYRADVVVSGNAVKYGDILVFQLSYSGTCERAGVIYDIVDSHVECVAKTNK